MDSLFLSLALKERSGSVISRGEKLSAAHHHDIACLVNPTDTNIFSFSFSGF